MARDLRVPGSRDRNFSVPGQKFPVRLKKFPVMLFREFGKKSQGTQPLRPYKSAICGLIRENSLFFPCLTGKSAETGSLETPCTASKSLISQKNTAGFELPVRFAAVRGPWRRAAAQAGPRERGLSALSAASQTFSLLAIFEVRFSRAIPRPVWVKGHELSPLTGSHAPGY